MRREQPRVAIIPMAVAIAMSMSLMPACARVAEEAGQGEDATVDVLVRGAEPGGMTAEWENAGEGVRATLEDDGKAFYKSDGEETSGMWLMSSPTDGELMLTDGRFFKLLLDEQADTLSVIDMSDGGPDGKVVAVLERDTGDADTAS